MTSLRPEARCFLFLFLPCSEMTRLRPEAFCFCFFAMFSNGQLATRSLFWFSCHGQQWPACGQKFFVFAMFSNDQLAARILFVCFCFLFSAMFSNGQLAASPC